VLEEGKKKLCYKRVGERKKKGALPCWTLERVGYLKPDGKRRNNKKTGLWKKNLYQEASLAFA